VKLLPEMKFADRLAGKLSKMHQQCFRMFPHIRIAFGTTQNSNTSTTKIKLLPEVCFATMPAGKLSKMHRQSFKMFSHFRIASGMAQNGNTSATKIMCQEIVKLLPEVYFMTMLAGKQSKMRRQSFRMFSHIRIAFGTAQNGNMSATKIMCQEIVKLLLEVYFMTMLAGKLSKMRRQSFRMFAHIRIASSMSKDGNTSATKIMGQEIMKLLLEVYFATMLAGKLSKMCWQCFRMFPTSGLHPAWPKMAIHRPQK